MEEEVFAILLDKKIEVLERLYGAPTEDSAVAWNVVLNMGLDDFLDFMRAHIK